MSRKLKISIIGAGNAGCITALHYYLYGLKLHGVIDNITIYYDKTIPIERVGQGITLNITNLLDSFFETNFYGNNILKATIKDGILYENWGKNNKFIFHNFPLGSKSIHYIPNLLSQEVLNCKLFNVVEKNIKNPEEEIDSDYVFDCRGKNNRNPELYETLVNPLNSVILSKKQGKDIDLTYTKCVATPNGWTFVIPNYDSVSYGYLYNNTITKKEEAAENFIDIFDVVPDGDFSFENYIAKNMWNGKRTIFNGNKLCFLEPLEATSVDFYQRVARCAWDHIIDGDTRENSNIKIKKEMSKIEKFIMWHYQFGSAYDTPFWDYAKSLPFEVDKEFSQILNICKNHTFMELKIGRQINYSQWPVRSFKLWQENV